MIHDPRGRLAGLRLQGNEDTDSTHRSSFPMDAPVLNQQRAETAKRRKMNALTEALLDPFTTTQESELASLMHLVKQPSMFRPSTRSKRI